MDKKRMFVQLIVSEFLEEFFRKITKLNNKLCIGETESFEILVSKNFKIIGNIIKKNGKTIYSAKTDLSTNSRSTDCDICDLFEKEFEGILRKKFERISETEKVVEWEYNY